jgi:hypothetical protein
LPLVYTAATATGLAIGAVLAPWEAVRIIGLTVLTGVGYGIANDMVACRDCIEYFTVGHIYDGTAFRNRALKTLDPNLNAIAWGAIATWHVCAIGGAPNNQAGTIDSVLNTGIGTKVSVLFIPLL